MTTTMMMTTMMMITTTCMVLMVMVMTMTMTTTMTTATATTTTTMTITMMMMMEGVVIVWPNNTFTSVTCAPSTTTFRPSTSAAVNTMIVCSAVDTTRTGTTSDADTKMTSSKTCNRYIYDTALKRTSDPSLQL